MRVFVAHRHDVDVHVYRRRLPHRDCFGVPSFVTWRLHGSLPRERVFARDHLSAGQAFAAWDRLLDSAQCGPRYLSLPEVASIVRDQLLRADCDLHAWVIMPNHVHVLWTPRGSVAQLVRSIKGASARLANRALSLSGPFWQDEYFDRVVADARQFTRVEAYIHNNPIRAGLASNPGEYCWQG